MNRRETLLATLAMAAVPLHARAQPKPSERHHRVGVLVPTSETAERRLPAIRGQLATYGYIEGRNIALDVRYSATNPDAAQDLLALKPNALLAVGAGAAQAAKFATNSVPIVFTWVADPVLSGIVKDFARPGGNITGVTNRYYELTVKRLELLRDLLPAAKRVAVAGPFHQPEEGAALRIAQQAAPRLGFDLIVMRPIAGVVWGPEIWAVVKAGAKAMSVFDPYESLGWRFGAAVVVGAAAEERFPSVFVDTETVEMGGLISYATNLDDDLRQSVGLLVRVLKGDKPADLPVQQASRFELAVNMKTAKAIGLKIPQTVLVRADRVIE